MIRALKLSAFVATLLGLTAFVGATLNHENPVASIVLAISGFVSLLILNMK